MCGGWVEGERDRKSHDGPLPLPELLCSLMAVGTKVVLYCTGTEHEDVHNLLLLV